jgi:hypothetical protein
MERRRAVRRVVSPDEPLSHARLRTGGHLRIVEASKWGALAETGERVLPGRHLDVHIVSAEGRVLVRCRVARAFVTRLQADAVHYRAALAFERIIDVCAAGYAVPAPFLASETERGMSYPHRSASSDIEFTDAPSAEQTRALPVVASPLV